MNERIAELVREKKLRVLVISEMSSIERVIRVVIDLKRGIEPETIKRQLYKYTSIESSFGFNTLQLLIKNQKHAPLKIF